MRIQFIDCLNLQTDILHRCPDCIPDLFSGIVFIVVEMRGHLKQFGRIQFLSAYIICIQVNHIIAAERDAKLFQHPDGITVKLHVFTVGIQSDKQEIQIPPCFGAVQKRHFDAQSAIFKACLHQPFILVQCLYGTIGVISALPHEIIGRADLLCGQCGHLVIQTHIAHKRCLRTVLVQNIDTRASVEFFQI